MADFFKSIFFLFFWLLNGFLGKVFSFLFFYHSLSSIIPVPNGEFHTTFSPPSCEAENGIHKSQFWTFLSFFKEKEKNRPPCSPALTPILVIFFFGKRNTPHAHFEGGIPLPKKR